MNMTEQYWIGDYYIDLTRNQITLKEQQQTVAPKAMAVLTYLARNQGKVISYDELLTEVWPDTIVTPNTLQRSIAQLRKVLGESSKVQSYIKTHAKQGYSLECNVQWASTEQQESIHQDNLSQDQTTAPEPILPITEPPRATDTEQELVNLQQHVEKQDSINTHTTPKNYIPRIILAALVILLVAFLSLKNVNVEKNTSLSFNKLRSITATKDKEFEASYTPDGKYIIFNRYLNQQCTNRIWAKDAITQEEKQLTSDWGTYGQHSLSPDGKSLTFVETTDCRTPIQEKNCYNLMTLNFEQALRSPQKPDLLVQCKDSRIRKPIWLNNNNIAVLRKYADRWQLIKYSKSTNESELLYDLAKGSLIDFTYSNQEQLIAVTSIHEDGEHYLDMLSVDGKLISSNKIKYTEGLSKFLFISPDFLPGKNQLIFTSGRQLFFLNYDGSMAKIDVPLGEWVSQPKFHPTENKLLLIKGPYDSDIASLPLGNLHKKVGYKSIESTTLGEEDATFQPSGDYIAFTSERSGENQLWITNGEITKQLSHFPIDNFFRGFEWAADGQSLLVNNSFMLKQIFLDGKVKEVNLPLPVLRLYHWDSLNNTALLTVYERGKSKLIKFNIITGDSIDLTEKKVTWAKVSQSGKVIYTDVLNRFWQPGPVEDQLIDTLINQGSSKKFSIFNNVIYGVNEENNLWAYDLNSANFEVLQPMPDNLDQLTDINETTALIEVRIFAKKGVIEFSSSD